jgi:hypothetical protein
VLYNFRIQSSVGFYSNFWRFSRSNWGTVKRSTPGHDVARARTAPAPRRLDIRAARAFPRPRASRGRAPSPGPCAPRRLEVRPPRVSPPCAPNRARRALRRPAIRPWLPPLHAHLPRPPPYHGRIFVTPSSRASEAAYLSAALPPRARPCRAAPPVEPSASSSPLRTFPPPFNLPDTFSSTY